MSLLVADVGGTNTRFELYEEARLTARVRYVNDDFESFDALLEAYLLAHGRPDSLCAAVAGRVDGGVVWMPNRGWELRERELRERLRAPVKLINDFHAQALAMPGLGSEDYRRLDSLDTHAERPQVVLGAGTGLGEAFLVPVAGELVVVPGEGGHGRYGPRGVRELRFLRWLMARYPGHVSVERVASGPGLVAAYDFLRGIEPRPAAMEREGAAAYIGRRAREGACALCVEAAEIFIDTLADEAATLAIKVNAGLVWLSGGVAPRLGALVERRFRAAFADKGRYRGWLETVPVRLVMHPDPGLLGAKIMAERIARCR